MEEINVQLVDDALFAEDFIRLKLATGFMNRPLNQVEDALKMACSMFLQFTMGKLLEWAGLSVMELCTGTYRISLFFLSTNEKVLGKAL